MCFHVFAMVSSKHGTLHFCRHKTGRKHHVRLPIGASQAKGIFTFPPRGGFPSYGIFTFPPRGCVSCRLVGTAPAPEFQKRNRQRRRGQSPKRRRCSLNVLPCFCNGFLQSTVLYTFVAIKPVENIVFDNASNCGLIPQSVENTSYLKGFLQFSMPPSSSAGSLRLHHHHHHRIIIIQNILHPPRVFPMRSQAREFSLSPRGGPSPSEGIFTFPPWGLPKLRIFTFPPRGGSPS